MASSDTKPCTNIGSIAITGICISMDDNTSTSTDTSSRTNVDYKSCVSSCLSTNVDSRTDAATSISIGCSADIKKSSETSIDS